MKKRKLFDFSVAYFVIFIITYALIFSVAIFSLIYSESKLGPAIGFSLILASFVFVIIRFGIMTARVDGKSVTKGKLSFKKKNAEFISKYDYRFKEPVIVIRDRRVKHYLLEKKESEKQSIRIQATPRNCRILGEFFGKEITPVKKTKRSLFKKKK